MKTNVAYNTLIKDLETLNIPFTKSKITRAVYNWIPGSPDCSNCYDFVILIAYQDDLSLLEVNLGYLTLYRDMYNVEHNNYIEEVDYHIVLSKVLNFYYENIDKTP